MTSKKANWLFLTIILVHIGAVLFLLFGKADIFSNIVANFFLSEGILIVPALVFLLLFERRGQGAGKPGAEAAAFHQVKISTLLMIALCTLMIMPLVTVLNTLTLFFTDNAVAALQGDILEAPFAVMLFMIGIFGPFCEEFVFRGVIYKSYRRSGAGAGAVLLSAALFGLMHMNFNQAVYAFAIGIFLAVLVEAAGSLWASVFCHMFFNSCQVAMMYVSGSLLESIYGQAAGEAAELTTQNLMAVLAVYLIIAAVTTPIAACIIVWIAKNEGRPDALRELFFGRRAKEAGQRQRTTRTQAQPMPPMQAQPQPMQPQPHTDYLLSVPLIVAVVLSLGYMSIELFL